jgi:hypothetical protein
LTLLDDIALGDGRRHSNRQKAGDENSTLHMFFPSWARPRVFQ